MASDPPSTPAPDSLDLDHLAQLANLPLSEEESRELAGACQQVLEAFSLAEAGGEDLDAHEQSTFEDEAQAWPEAEVETILDQVPHLEGRRIRP